MTTEETTRIIDQVIQNCNSSAELRMFRDGLLRLAREEQSKYLAENFSIEQLRAMGIDI